MAVRRSSTFRVGYEFAVVSRESGICARDRKEVRGGVQQSACIYLRPQVNTEDMAKFQTDPTIAPATPAIHQAWSEVKTYDATPTFATAPSPQIK